MENLKLEVGARIRIAVDGGDYGGEYFEGATATVVDYSQIGDEWVQLDVDHGCYRVSKGDFEIIGHVNDLTHSEYYKTYGTLTEERILDLLAVYEKAAGVTCCSDEEHSGWVEWEGGACPVSEGTMVDVKYRNGEEKPRLAALRIDRRYPNDASGAFWLHDGMNNDIVAYRLSER